MLQLNPLENFTIFRQIGDHTDTSRDDYYVRATIRNSFTAEKIAEVNLTNKTNGEYYGNWTAPADNTVDGFWICITTSVYTDSGYTTKSNKYADVADTYLIGQRAKRTGAGGGGVYVDYDRIKKMIKDEIAAIKIPKAPKIPKTDFTEILGLLEALSKDFNTMYKKLDNPAIKIPKPEKLDYERIQKENKSALADLYANIFTSLEAIEAKIIQQVQDAKESLEKKDISINVALNKEDLTDVSQEFDTIKKMILVINERLNSNNG